MLPPFQNEPVTDFSLPANREAFCEALRTVKARFGQTYPLIVGGEEIHTSKTFPTLNPARPDEVLAHFALAGPAEASHAVETAARAFETWRFAPVETRARILVDAAAEMRRRKHEFSATMVYEVGKSWAEADADTAEAIDFMEYYARQALRIADSSHLLGSIPDEKLGLYYIPLGVGIVIPPWNFPNAIVTGMTSAALVAGNSVILKPAEPSPLIARMIAELFWNNGLPKGVLNYVSGPGRIAGQYMVDHPRTRFIAFTGSREVGLRIFESASKVHESQIWLKRTVLEMGGKDAVVVDETADLEAAAQGIVASAFGYQGQKCSAGSRAILVDSIYDRVAERVVELTRELSQGATDQSPDVDQGPVVNQKSYEKILEYIEIGKGEGKLLAGGHAVDTPEKGYFIAPTIFGDVDPQARIAQEEIFGPVLALIRARDFDHALEIANGTEYGLTGALYSLDRARITRAEREFHVGNLYFNRKCTGAMVGIHPFGGFNMSGTDSKAGGPDYLLLFTQAKSIAEKIL
jgi:1-pyrroline-5-carboxylate dehydrogenase